MKSDHSPGDLNKKIEKFSKKELSNRIRFFYSELPYETRTSLFLSLLVY